MLDRKTVILDGHNNRGFSGGPVVFTEPNRNEFKVAAIISGYLPVEEPVHGGAEDADLWYQYNTGLIVADAIDPALDLIRANPIGYELV